MGRSDPLPFPVAGPLETGTLVLGLLVQGLPTIILTWLILATARRWLDAVLTRAYTPVLVRPAPRGVQPWLLFTMVLLALESAGLLIGRLPLVAVSVFVGGTPLDNPELAALGVTPAILRATLLNSAARWSLRS